MNAPSRPPESASTPPFLPPQEVEGADADLFDYAKLRDYLQYVLHSALRHRLLVAVIFIGLIGAAVQSVRVLPSTYHCEIKIQAQRNVVISTVAGLQRSWDWELPTHSASDLVLRHDNLVALVRKTDLVRVWESSRAPVMRLKDRMMRELRGELSPESKEDAMIGTLEQRLSVQTTEDAVTIGIDWPDATTAYRLIQAAHANFLEARQYKEISGISEAVGLLEGRSADAREAVYADLERLQKLRPPKTRAKSEQPKPVVRLPQVDPDLQRLRGQLQSKRQVLLEMEEFRNRRIAGLQSKLMELKQIYSEFHPAVIDLQQTLDEQQRESNPQLVLLGQEFRKLQDEYERRGGPALNPPESLSAAQLPAEAVRLTRSRDDELETPEVEQAKADLRHDVSQYSSLVDRIDQAKLELQAQRAAFQYRYGVLRPAAVPKVPVKPKKPLVYGGAAIMGLLLGVFAAVILDIRTGRILERWQLSRQLGLPVLAEVRRP
jgi:uncharacterized protein involved in exopolysaccharide biosynthesis